MAKANEDTIGGDNKLNVIVASYKPNMRCNSFPGPPWSSCVSLFSEMPADKNRQTFGHLPHQRVQVQLPLTYTAGKILLFSVSMSHLLYIADRRCMVKMDINGEPTGLSWYEVWEAVVAVASACVHERQKCGKATGLGWCDRHEVIPKAANDRRSRPEYLPATVRRAP